MDLWRTSQIFKTSQINQRTRATKRGHSRHKKTYQLFKSPVPSVATNHFTKAEPRVINTLCNSSQKRVAWQARAHSSLVTWSNYHRKTELAELGVEVGVLHFVGLASLRWIAMECLVHARLHFHRKDRLAYSLAQSRLQAKIPLKLSIVK